jgi:hypothetical protein
VFLAQLEKLKGTDASWEDDLEPPPDELISSGDELLMDADGVPATGKNAKRKIAKG